MSISNRLARFISLVRSMLDGALAILSSSCRGNNTIPVLIACCSCSCWLSIHWCSFQLLCVSMSVIRFAFTVSEVISAFHLHTLWESDSVWFFMCFTSSLPVIVVVAAAINSFGVCFNLCVFPFQRLSSTFVFRESEFFFIVPHCGVCLCSRLHLLPRSIVRHRILIHMKKDGGMTVGRIVRHRLLIHMEKHVVMQMDLARGRVVIRCRRLLSIHVKKR